MAHILTIAGRREVVRNAGFPGLWRQFVGTSSAKAIVKEDTPQEAARPFEEIPGPRGLPFIGTSLEYTRFGRFPMHTKMANSTIERYKTYGKIYREKFGLGEMVFVCDPKDIETVLRNDGRYPERLTFNSLKTYRHAKKMPDALVTLMGEEWFRVRSAVNKDMMRPTFVAAHTTIQDDVTRDLIGLMQAIVRKGENAGQISNFTNTLYKWSLEALSIVILRKRLGCLALDELAEDSDAQLMITASTEFFDHFAKLETSLPLYKYFSTPTWKKFKRSLDTMNSVAEKLVGERITELRKREKLPEEGDFLTNLMSRKDISYDEAIMVVMELVNGALETTTHTLVFILFCLAKNPRAQQKLYEEIMEVVPPGQPIDDKMLNKMHYLRAVFKESFRLYPTFLNSVRVINRDLVLAGYHVPAKTHVLMAQNVISTLPEYYPEPEVYIPERWLRTAPTNIHPFSLLPFSFGSRMCLGRRFAEQEIYLALIRILQIFHVGWEGEDMKQVWRLINVPDRDSFVFQERQ